MERNGAGAANDARVGCGCPDGAAFMWDVCCPVDSGANKRSRGRVEAQKIRVDVVRINAD